MSTHTLPPHLHVPASESQHIVRERNFSSADLDTVLSDLHLERATGQLIVDLTQGSVGTVRFKERYKVFPDTK